MYCSKCGNELKDNSILCERCGTPTGDSGSQMAQQQPPYQQPPYQQQYGQPYTQPYNQPYTQPYNQAYAPPNVHQIHVTKHQTSLLCKVFLIILSVISIILCFMPWVNFNYWFDSEHITIFDATMYFIKLDDMSYSDDLSACCLGFLAATIAVVVAIIMFVASIFNVATENTSAKTTVTVANVSGLIGSIIAFIVMYYISENTYSILDIEPAPFFLCFFCIIQLIISKNIRDDVSITRTKMIINEPYLSDEQLRNIGKWRCAFCKTVNASYIGSCSCGHKREESVR